MSRSLFLAFPLLLAACVTTRYDEPPPPVVEQTTTTETGSRFGATTETTTRTGPLLPPLTGTTTTTGVTTGVTTTPVVTTNPPITRPAAVERKFATPIPGRDDVVRNPYDPTGAPIKVKNLSSGAADYRSGAELYNPGSNRTQIIVIP